MTTTKPKKTTKKQAAPDVAEFATEAPVPDEAGGVTITEPYTPEEQETTVSINGGPHVPMSLVREALDVLKGES